MNTRSKYRSFEFEVYVNMHRSECFDCHDLFYQPLSAQGGAILKYSITHRYTDVTPPPPTQTPHNKYFTSLPHNHSK